MYIPEFLIPLNREDLIQVAENEEYYVKYLYSPKELQKRLEDASSSLSEEGPAFIVDHFPTFYSLLQHFEETTVWNRQKAWSIISKAFMELIGKLKIVLNDIKNTEIEVKNDMRNITKMVCYILVELMGLFQDKCGECSDVLDAKGKKKQKSVAGDEWTENRLKILYEIYSFLQLQLKLLWDPPVVDEEFVNLIANFCYKCLEDTNISNSSMKYFRETVFQLIGVLIKNYLHGLSFCVKVVQLLKSNEHVVIPLARGTVQLVQECKCTNIVKEIIREITETDGDHLAADASGTRSLNQYLVQVAEAIPETIIPNIELLINHLSGDSYTMRMCVLEVLGEIVVAILSKENLNEDLKRMRDEYLEYLEEHIHDVNAFVRSKVLQIWQKLCSLNSIPVSRLNHLLELTIGRLNDKSTNVKKHAIHLIKDLLESNPYSGQLNTTEIQGLIKEEMDKLQMIKKTHNVEIIDAACEWKTILPKLENIVENLEEKSENSETELENLNDVMEEKMKSIGDLLVVGEYDAAVKELATLKNKCNVLFDVEHVNLVELLQLIFNQRVNGALLNLPFEVQEKINKCKITIEYLENALKFADLINVALPIILTLLDSGTVTDVLESIHFFTAAYLFGFHQALEGVRKMLYLMYSKDEVIRSAVSEAYENLYFDKKVQGRHHALSTIKNLSDLILQLNESQLNALEIVVRKWFKMELIDKNFIQVMFERFSKKLANTTDEYSWAALVLIKMIGSEEPCIIRSNISVLLSQGLSDPGNQNFIVAKEVCKALLQLIPNEKDGKPVSQKLRYPCDHDIFIILYKFLRDSLWRFDDFYFVPLAEVAINLVFKLCQQPDTFCERLITEIYEGIVNSIIPLTRKEKRTGKTLMDLKNFEGLLDEEQKISVEETNTSEPTKEDIYKRDIILMTRFIAILGQVAANYILYLEGPVINELKRRNQVDFERKMRRVQEKKSKTHKNNKELEILNNDRFNKSELEAGEDHEFNRVAADDIDAEEMKKKTENEIVTGEGYFTKFIPIVLTICKNPGKYHDKSLQSAAVLTLAKFMMVSSIFCEEQLQLLVTICEKSNCPLIRKNALIALGALQYRFPNTLEPWTPNMYGILKDPDPVVRLSAVLVLTDLIVNEMIKVRANISDLALCIVDKDPTIAKTVRYFFREYSLKGNSLFNLVPCLISNLIRPDSSLTEDEFKTIMAFILNLFTKDKQSEYLIDKLFQYFESASTERQWKELSFCLSLLNYNEKGLKKILENFRYFGNKLYLADVYEAFCDIIKNASKNHQKDKTLLKELQDIIKEYREKSCQDRSITVTVQNKIMSSGNISVSKRILPRSTDKPLKARRKLINVEKEIREDDCEFDDSDDGAFLSDTSVKKCMRTRLGSTRKIGIKGNALSDYDSENDECPKKHSKKVKTVRIKSKEIKIKK